MKSMFLALAAFAPIAFANPVATLDVDKTWERCVISAGASTSTVSCAVGYKAKDFLNEPFYVSVPVIIPVAMANAPAALQMILKPRLELDGKIFEPQAIRVGKGSMLPEGTAIADCRFNCNFSASRAPKLFGIVVSYEQPTIEGMIYYLPLFEQGRNPADLAEFTVSFFPTDGKLLSLESKHKQEPTVFKTRITIRPSHDELIKVGLR